MGKNNRNYPLDLSRTLCIVWIVAFFHMLNYFPKESQPQEMVGMVLYDITICVLSCFTYLSGYFLSKYSFINTRDVWAFYKKRLVRFFPLFVIACFSLIICGSDLKQIIFAVLGLSLIIPPPIYTLWYMSMLMLFYFITPLLRFTIDGDSNIICRANILKVIFIILIFALSFMYADRRLTLYLPFYIIGLNIPHKRAKELITNVYVFAISFILFAVLMIIRLKIYPNYISNFILPVESFAGVLVILSLSQFLYTDKIQRIVSWISEGSLCAYLFHRFFYAIILIITSMITGSKYMTIPLSIVSFIVLLVLSFYIQKLYNVILKRV